MIVHYFNLYETFVGKTIVLLWSKLRSSTVKETKTNLGFLGLKLFYRIASWCQFHHHFTSSFYTHISQKCKQLFALLGSAVVKAEGKKNIDEIDPWSLWSQFHWIRFFRTRSFRTWSSRTRFSRTTHLCTFCWGTNVNRIFSFLFCKKTTKTTLSKVSILYTCNKFFHVHNFFWKTMIYFFS